jgi:DNA-dependent protein kinase catalytic subunit
MKLATAKRKLRGAHPVAVMRDELDQRPNPKFKKDWKKLAEGEAHSVRAKIKCAPKLKTDSEFEEVICVEDQVKCLIDLATDVNLLGRLWVGWESHV